MSLTLRPQRSNDQCGSTVVHVDVEGLLHARTPTAQERMLVRLRAQSLSRNLAVGVSPESSVLLALRAQELSSPPTRRMLADALNRILNEPRQRPLGRRGYLAPPRRSHILSIRPELQDLITQLLAATPVSAQGVAQVWLLVTDGTGPLHSPRPQTQLREVVVEATRALDPTRNLDKFDSGP
jgi:hypothetical protein